MNDAVLMPELLLRSDAAQRIQQAQRLPMRERLLGTEASTLDYALPYLDPGERNLRSPYAAPAEANKDQGPGPPKCCSAKSPTNSQDTYSRRLREMQASEPRIVKNSLSRALEKISPPIWA